MKLNEKSVARAVGILVGRNHFRRGVNSVHAANRAGSSALTQAKRPADHKIG
jgi:hypothetical protein